eukprot:7303457-Alexandrium_andersonii.AAC.1
MAPRFLGMVGKLWRAVLWMKYVGHDKRILELVCRMCRSNMNCIHARATLWCGMAQQAIKMVVVVL